jgi:flagellar hook-associated protein 2
LPTTPSSNGAGLIQNSGDAAYKLDGISRTSSSNTISYAAPGLSLKLTGTNSGAPTTITYSDPSSSIKTTMSNLVAALNTLVSEVNTDTSASGSLYGDTAARA